ncbi:hypothetical protein H4Q26_013745 [Puccinia striiformis f. sp. tritici PST-130]|nr:hypothetical protein H4Q26_013745 [Puccinia striiformis f. sp. tritici PST-130]
MREKSVKGLDRSKDWRDQRISYTAVESPPQSTPNNKELIELEQETAAPWVTGKKATEPNTGPSDLSAARRGKSKRTREQLEEDEILQEVLEEEAAIARLTEAAKNQEPVAGQASESDSLLARHQIRKKMSTPVEGSPPKKEVLEIDEGFVVAEKEVRLDANKVPEEKDRLFNWSSDDEEEIDVLQKSKEELKSKVISIGEETAKAVAKLMKMKPKGLKEEAKIVRRDLAEAVEGKIRMLISF